MRPTLLRLVPLATLTLALGACGGGTNAQTDAGTDALATDAPVADGTGIDVPATDAPAADTRRTDTLEPEASVNDAGTRPDTGPDAGGTQDAARPDSGAQGNDAATAAAIQTVFVILMENHNWSQIKGSTSAPYINNVLLPMSSYTDQYYNPPGNHPSEPNYIWLEAGDNLGITTDSDPVSSTGTVLNAQSTTDHLVTYLERAGLSWRSYQEDITGTSCPLHGRMLYAPKHNPMIYFEDVTDTNSTTSQHCISHVRPYTELASDLAAGTVARYNFITPNLCDDMHNSTGCVTTNSVRNGDDWLAANVPAILQSAAYQNNGVLFITWDEGEGGDGPIGMIVLSPLAKGGGYHNTIHYTHSSTLRTVQEIFGVTPLLRDAANATDLSDLFSTFP